MKIKNTHYLHISGRAFGNGQIQPSFCGSCQVWTEETHIHCACGEIFKDEKKADEHLKSPGIIN